MPVVAAVVAEAEAGEAVAEAVVEGAVSTVAGTAPGEEEEEDTEEVAATDGEPGISIAAIRLIIHNWSRFGPVFIDQP